jgi:hypothetical protein
VGRDRRHLEEASHCDDSLAHGLGRKLEEWTLAEARRDRVGARGGAGGAGHSRE